MKVIKKQPNSKMCFICGLENQAGVKAEFYSMEDQSVISIFNYREFHQSYPGRVHGGAISAMLDELGFRAMWVKDENVWGVTMSLETKYRKPVPYDIKLKGKGYIVKESSKFVLAKAEIYDMEGITLASADIKYIKLNLKDITDGIDIHEEMCYLVEDNITEIN